MRTLRFRTGISLLDVIVVLLVIVFLCVLMAYVERTSHENSRRAICFNNFRQLGLALTNYHDTFRCLPLGCGSYYHGQADRRFSGLVSLLEYVTDESPFHKVNFGIGVDDVGNSTARRMRVQTFLCPSDDAVCRDGLATASYLLCAGIGPSVLPVDNRGENVRGCFAQQSSVKVADITDGAASSVAFFESCVGASSPISPQRQYVGGLTRSLDCSDDFGLADFRAGRNLLTDRGSSWMDGRYLQTLGFMRLAPNSSTPDAAFADFSGGVGGPRSMHPKGVQVCFVDGSVRSLSQAVDPKIVQAYGTIDGGERVREEE